MQEIFGHCNGAFIMLHGGAGLQDPSGDAIRRGTEALRSYVVRGHQLLSEGKLGLDVVTACLQMMEDDPQFNAGCGAALQADGQARLTAALMDGDRQAFSGVISVSYLKNPSLIARALQSRDTRVVTAPGAELTARSLGLPVETPVTAERVERWLASFKNSAQKKASSFDTVGCVVRTTQGQLFAGTSTGGRGFEFPGRVSDSATVAGNYASAHAAFSATGTGEQIVDDALCARLETRVRDGLTLEEAVHRTVSEAKQRDRQYGFIAITADGFWGAAHLTPAMTWVAASPTGIVGSS